MHRAKYYCAFCDIFVEGIKPSEYSPVILVTPTETDKLPDSDKLILEDSDGFRYQRIGSMTHNYMVFERV